MNSFLTFLVMNSTQKASSDWMMIVVALLVATFVGSVMSPQVDSDASSGGSYAVEPAI